MPFLNDIWIGKNGCIRKVCAFAKFINSFCKSSSASCKGKTIGVPNVKKQIRLILVEKIRHFY